MRFFVVRHGETAWNVEGRFQGQMDIPLNNKGIVQAERLAQRFIGHKFSAIISSPLSRAHVTAAKIAEVAVYDEFITDALLTEINHGDWEGCLADEIKKSCQRTFQALRIDVNREFEVLDEFLEKLPDVLAKDGRVAILSFHSGEDRRVKKSFKHFFREGIYREISPDPIRPSSEECHVNSRARSAKLRWAIKS